jgi:hypothetical protein
MGVYNIDWFKSELAPKLEGYKLEYKFFNEGDLGPLNQVEFNSKEIDGNIDFLGLDWLGIFVLDYQKEEELLNQLIKPDQEEERKAAINKLKAYCCDRSRSA